MDYYMITSSNTLIKKYDQVSIGINQIDTDEFSNYYRWYSVFTLDFIANYYSEGNNLHQITLLKSDEDYSEKIAGNKLYVTKVNVNKTYSLFDFDTYTELDLDIIKNKSLIDFASEYNRIDVLDQWIDQLLNLEYTTNAIDVASEYNLINVLDWWLSVIHFSKKMNYSSMASSQDAHFKYDLILKYTYESIDNASKNNQIDVLNWWLNAHINHGLKLLYTTNAMVIKEKDRVHILDWWLDAYLKHDLPLKYDFKAMSMAASHGLIEVLDWFFNAHLKHGLELKYETIAITCASMNNHIDVLDWFLNAYLKYDLELKYDNYAIDFACEKNHILVLDWFLNAHLKHDLELKYDHKAFDSACSQNHINVLDWFFNNHRKINLELKYSSNAIDFASRLRYLGVLDWFVNSGLEMKYTNNTIDFALENNNINVLKWWIKHHLSHHLKLKYSDSYTYEDILKKVEDN